MTSSFSRILFSVIDDRSLAAWVIGTIEEQLGLLVILGFIDSTAQDELRVAFS